MTAHTDRVIEEALEIAATVDAAPKKRRKRGPNKPKPTVVAAKLTTDAAERKQLPIVTGVLDYFPDALLEVARVSFVGNQQHNPGQPLHWAKGKSQDEENAAVRHILERFGMDTDGTYHAAKTAWRALAFLQKLIEAKKAGMSYADYNKHLRETSNG